MCLCPQTCVHYSTYSDLLSIYKSENWKILHSFKFHFGDYNDVWYLFICLLAIQSLCHLPFSYYNFLFGLLIYFLMFYQNFFCISFRILVLTSVEQKSQETILKVDQISQILRNNLYFFCYMLWILVDVANLVKRTDYVVEEKCGCRQLTNCKIYLIMVLKIAFKYILHRKHLKYCGDYSIDIW